MCPVLVGPRRGVERDASRPGTPPAAHTEAARARGSRRAGFRGDDECAQAGALWRRGRRGTARSAHGLRFDTGPYLRGVVGRAAARRSDVDLYVRRPAQGDRAMDGYAGTDRVALRILADD